MRRSGRASRILAAAAVAAALTVPCQAYYHYIHYASRNAPYTAIPDAFDLKALPHNTLTFFASSKGPVTYGKNDTFGAVLSQVKQAAAVWNSVPTSDLRIAFGGLETYTSEGNSKTPAGDVIFEDLPPGILGMGGVTISNSATVTSGQNGAFLPIARGLVILTSDTTYSESQTYGPGPSYLESFFTTAVHEFGHALGLQHTWTSAAMTQDSSFRNTSRARPIDADDIAALSVLYGKQDWSANYGSISGQVAMGGAGVAMASVVALPARGPAVSALTNPDGTYSIKGLPPNDYLLYVHPLPPSAISSDGSGLALPADMTGTAFPIASGAFQTVFYPGTTALHQASTFAVTAGQSFTADFTVQSRSSATLYDVSTYSFLDTNALTYTWSGQIGITPAFVDINRELLTVVAKSSAGSMPAPRSVKIVGGDFQDAIVWPYGEPTVLALYFYTPSAPVLGPHHLVFEYADDLFVLPEGLNLVRKAPPSNPTFTGNSDGSVTVKASRMGPDTRVYFDGLPASVTQPFSGGEGTDGSFTVTPPPGASAQVATITVANSDGQSSMFWKPEELPVHNYATIDAPQITGVTPNVLPAGVTAMVEITATGMDFVKDHVTLGFGTGDISVRRVWVISPTRLIANVAVAANAATGFPDVSVISGFRVASLPGGFQIGAADSVAPAISLPAARIYAGSTVTLAGSNLAMLPSAVQLKLNDVPVVPSSVTDTEIVFTVPEGTASGPAILRLFNGFETVPLVLEVDVIPPTILAIMDDTGATTLDAHHAAKPGDLVSVLVNGLDDATARRGRLHVTVSGVPMTIQEIALVTAGQYRIHFALSQSFGSSVVPVVVSLDGSPSKAYEIAAR